MGGNSSKHHEKNINTSITTEVQQPEVKKKYYIDEDLPIPKLDASSKLLNDQYIKVINSYLPNDDFRKTWKLLFSSTRDGHSFNRFVHHVADKGSTIVLVKEEGDKGHIFGGFAMEPWKPKYPKFYGTEKGFVFRLHPEIEVYRPTGADVNFQYLNTLSKTLYNGIGMGGVPYLFGWVIDESFDQGHSKGTRDEDIEGGEEISSTFGNPPLASSSEFNVEYVECWQVKEDIVPDDDLLDDIVNKKKGKSVLSTEENADKVIKSLLGHEFTHYNEDNESSKKRTEESR
ncbi:hypothetical protein DLAC_04673 [Tieghemostelium lacteum]|uniref:TLDc domain-containing protein n=1 Tax=Tieghemostelium lacteum TaxID=361077 RepID=A0A151ZKD2_TIELA|nr:hypothetical protein DLAC_04673 [Tieghemostelium lacteum]|eukprot:KYQ94375.1 hypothetical protein DLAC_04673 [Tieghemostelium lacteum]